MVRIFKYRPLEKVFEPALRDSFAKRFVEMFSLERICGIATVEPLVAGVEDIDESARSPARILLPVAEFAPVDESGDAAAVEPFQDNPLHGLAGSLPHLFRLAILDVFHEQERAHLRPDPAERKIHVLAKALAQKSLLKRRLVGVGERIGEDLHRKFLFPVAPRAVNPAVHQNRLVRGGIVLANLVWHRLLRRDRPLERDGRVNLPSPVGGKERIELRQHREYIHASVEEDARVRRMVVAEVEILVLLERQVMYARRIAARAASVAVAGEKHLAKLVARLPLRASEHPLHLAQHDAVANKFPVLHLVVPALLTER